MVDTADKLNARISALFRVGGLSQQSKLIDVSKENPSANTIRVFSRKEMKDYIKDANPSEIKVRGKDIKVMDLDGGYLVNRVELQDGIKGYVWSKNQKLD